ncbi:MAG: hypothetical protein KGL34_13235, partial [Gammaproteobacteria bacterium]|nr:hypothetical protein [Gammaproteobacteria bacterium]
MGIGSRLGLGIDRSAAFDTHDFDRFEEHAQESLRRLTHRHEAAVEHLLRDHADLVEADPDGDPVVRGQILASFPSEAALSQALALGFSIRRDHPLPALGLHFAVLVDPPHWSLGKSLRALRRTIPTGTFDYDQIYFASGGARAGPR